MNFDPNSPEAQQVRFNDMKNSAEARRLKADAEALALRALAAGFHVEISWISHPLHPRRLRNIEITPSRDAYQSTK